MCSKYFVIIPAAGIGKRFGKNVPKQYTLLFGKPILQHVLDIFLKNTIITRIYLVVNTEDHYVDKFFSVFSGSTNKITLLRYGGNSRQETVLQSLYAIRKDVNDDDWILVHDSVRPGLSNVLLDKLLKTISGDTVGGLLAIPIVDTLKYYFSRYSLKTLTSYKMLWAAQTPQMFRYSLLFNALLSVKKKGLLHKIKDDSSAIEIFGFQPKLIIGSLMNFKITIIQDIELISFLLKEKS